MSIQIQPQKNFAIVRQLPDPSDATTYYVQAEIRNAETDTLIATIKLTDKGSRRFVAVWHAIADKSGQGTLISIMTAVYTDSGYTTPSPSYSQEIETYLILERFNPNEIVRALGPAMGGDGIKVDYKQIKKLIDESIAEKITPILKSLEDLEKSDTDEEIVKEIRLMLISATRDIKECMPSEAEPPEKMDYDFIFLKMEAIKSAIIDSIESKEVTEKPDLSPLVDLIQQVKDEIVQGQKPTEEIIKKVNDTLDNFVGGGKDMSEVAKMIAELKNILGGVLVGKNINSLKEDRPTIDFSKRAKELLG